MPPTTGSIKQSNTPSPFTIDWASLGQSEFDLPGTSVSASRSRPDPQLVINLETLGRSDVTMPGDEGEAVTSVTQTLQTMTKVGRGQKLKKNQGHRRRERASRLRGET